MFFRFLKNSDPPRLLHFKKFSDPPPPPVIKESADMELLGLIIDKKLSFAKKHCKIMQTALYKLHALRRIRKYLTLEKARALRTVFVDSQFKGTLIQI